MSSVPSKELEDVVQTAKACSIVAENVFNSNNINSTDYKAETVKSASSSETTIPSQVAQWVYIQTPPKMSLSSTKSSSANIVVNTVPPLQISSISNKNIPISQSITLPANQGVILAHPVSNTVKPQHLYIQKPTGVQTVPVVPVSVTTNVGPKNTLAYLTMIKAPHNLNMSSNNQKYVIAPMPKLTSNRLPATVTTNCVQSKFALLPVPLQNNKKVPKHKLFNIKIADGQLQTENNGAIRIMCDSGGKDEMEQEDIHTTTKSSREEESKLLCNEIINVENPPKKDCLEEKSYELSIVEDGETNNDISFTITIPDENKDLLKSSQFRDSFKFSKHGVSILKRSFNLDVKSEKNNSVITSSPSNCTTTISDSISKKVKVATSLSVEEKKSPQPPPPPPPKSERRRKSNFAYRKDYDEIIITSETWNDSTMNEENVEPSVKSEETKLSNNSEIEIKIINEKPDINMNNDFDAKKVLKWEEGIGTLPGSDIKFKINEFGFLEYLKKDECKDILDKKSKENSRKSDLQDDMRCVECGCYGLPSDFISPKYCSYDCQDAGNKVLKQKEAKWKRRSKTWLKKANELRELKAEKDEYISEEDSTSNDCSQDKFNYPWNCAKKGFSWPKYLDHVKAKGVPVKFFKDPFPYNRNGFRPGMKLEGIDPQHPSYFCVLTVAEVIGYRMRLHFDGYSESYDFWVNADSMDIFPAGWCEKYGHVLRPPPGAVDFNWSHYLKSTKGTVAPKHLFANRAGSAICPNGFRVGMKLEAVDRKNTSLVCVATVSNMMDNRILVHFDSWDDIYDYWADPTSPYIHPVGWADLNGRSLTPPNDYPNPESFTWSKYLKERKASGAPVRAFKQRPIYGFKRGMRLECVDKRVPQLIRVASVDDIKEHQLRICFDGWPDRYSYWVDNDCPDIHPVGWCQKTGHPIEPPLTPDDVYDFLECPTVGCRGQGHITGAKYSTHSLPSECPYSDENIHREHILPDRLLSPDRQLESVIPISREPKEKIKTLKSIRPPKMPKLHPSNKVIWDNDEGDIEDNKILKRKPLRQYKNTNIGNGNKTVPLTNGYTNTYMEQIWEKHSKNLNFCVKKNSEPQMWRIEDVVHFISTVPSCENYCALFIAHKIDGEAFLMLSQKDLIEILGIKLGPAVKLYSIIMLLRESVRS